jgi:hypothetical protein
MSLFGRKVKKPEQLRVSHVKFLGSQDGSPEIELKAQLYQLFAKDVKIQRGYLARVAYGGDERSVALCVRMESDPDPALAQHVMQVFASMFGKREHLDIIFLNDAQEAELVKCCQPFYGVHGTT